MQRVAVEKTAAARCDEIVLWYEERRSAKTTARPELTRLRADSRMGKVKTLYVFKLDRLVRSGVADAFALVDELRRGGVTIVAAADNLVIRPDKDDVLSEVLVFALGLAARLERTAINDRIAAARERVEAEGRRWGRPRRVDKPTLMKAARMRAVGKTIREIAAALKVPRSTIAAALAVSGKDAPNTTPDPSGKCVGTRGSAGASE